MIVDGLGKLDLRQTPRWNLALVMMILPWGGAWFIKAWDMVKYLIGR